MVFMNLIMSSKQTENEFFAFKQKENLYLKLLFALTIGFFTLWVDNASAQAATAGGLCVFAGWLKTLATTAAIIAVIMVVLNSLFMKSSVVGDIIVTVIIGCVIMAAAPYIISLTGLAPNCSI